MVGMGKSLSRGIPPDAMSCLQIERSFDMPEFVQIKCPDCQRPLQVRRAFVGKTGRCPSCGSAVPIETDATSRPEPVHDASVLQDADAGTGGIDQSPVRSTPETQPGGPSITPAILQQLKETRPWVTSLSALNFIAVPFWAFMGFAGGRRPGIGAMFVLCWGFGSAGICMLWGWLLMNYGMAIKRLLAQPTSTNMAQAMLAQKSFWRCIGILAYIGIGIVAVALLFGIVTAMA